MHRKKFPGIKPFFYSHFTSMYKILAPYIGPIIIYFCQNRFGPLIFCFLLFQIIGESLMSCVWSLKLNLTDSASMFE